jgi:hypothetical protein
MKKRNKIKTEINKRKGTERRKKRTQETEKDSDNERHTEKGKEKNKARYNKIDEKERGGKK